MLSWKKSLIWLISFSILVVVLIYPKLQTIGYAKLFKVSEYSAIELPSTTRLVDNWTHPNTLDSGIRVLVFDLGKDVDQSENCWGHLSSENNKGVSNYLLIENILEKHFEPIEGVCWRVSHLSGKPSATVFTKDNLLALMF